jgi:hypothetical protein
MIRTQIQMEAPTYERLKKRAAELQCSVSELARQGIEEKLARQEQENKWSASFAALGRHGSGLKDLSERHDDYLCDGWGKDFRGYLGLPCLDGQGRSLSSGRRP